MKRPNKKFFLCMWLLLSLIWQAIPVSAQEANVAATIGVESSIREPEKIIENLLKQGRGAEFSVMLVKIFGDDAAAAQTAFDGDSQKLLVGVSNGASRKAIERLEQQIKERREKPATKTLSEPKTNVPAKAKPPVKPAMLRKLSFNSHPKLDWRQFAFGFQPLQKQDNAPEIKITETDKEIISTGADKKSFETKDAKGNRTQTAETRYTKDGTNFGVEIKNHQIIEASSKVDGKKFRSEILMNWGATVAACPDLNGISSGTGKAKVVSKTIYTDEANQWVTVSTEFELQAKVTGYVNDEAEFTHYDLQIDAYATNTGQEEALKRNLTKEIKLKDGKYGLNFNIAENTIEKSDGTYRGERTPAKLGKVTARKLTEMTDADTQTVGAAIGPMVPAIWNSANNMYAQAQENWKNNGCVEIICRVAKNSLKAGETVNVSAETVHLQDKSKVSARLDAEAGPGTVTPDSQQGKPGAVFTFTKEGEESSYLTMKSISKRGIGEISLTFEKELEEPSEAGAWTGTIDVRRHRYEEREKRSGANLAENGGYFETLTYVKFKLTGRLDRTVEANNANIAKVTGNQTYIDHEYDRYKVDEGYCGPNAVPYKGEKEITRTSTTKAEYNKETRVYMEVGSTGGTITFALPENNGTTVHKYVHQSPCAEHDRANTNEATDEDVATVGGSFSFSIPADSSQKTIRGTVSVTEEDGSKTEYTWELRRK